MRRIRVTAWAPALFAVPALTLAMTGVGCGGAGNAGNGPDDKSRITDSGPAAPGVPGTPGGEPGVAVRPDPYRPPADPVIQPAPAGPQQPYPPAGGWQNNPIQPTPPGGGYQQPAPAPGYGYPQAPAAPGGAGMGPGGTYVVQRGDTLYVIASKVYGATNKHDQNVGANRIYEANRSVIGPSKDRLVVGMKLNIPGAGNAAAAPVADPYAPGYGQGYAAPGNTGFTGYNPPAPAPEEQPKSPKKKTVKAKPVSTN